jgi:hypothetical protein
MIGTVPYRVVWIDRTIPKARYRRKPALTGSANRFQYFIPVFTIIIMHYFIVDNESSGPHIIFNLYRQEPWLWIQGK